MSYKHSLFCSVRVAAENCTWKFLTFRDKLDVIKHYEVGQTPTCAVLLILERVLRNIKDIAEERKKAVLKQKYVITVERVYGPQI